MGDFERGLKNYSILFRRQLAFWFEMGVTMMFLHRIQFKKGDLITTPKMMDLFQIFKSQPTSNNY